MTDSIITYLRGLNGVCVVPAVAALLYRAVSCWLVLGIGWVSYATMRHGKPDTAPAIAAA